MSYSNMKPPRSAGPRPHRPLVRRRAGTLVYSGRDGDPFRTVGVERNGSSAYAAAPPTTSSDRWASSH